MNPAAFSNVYSTLKAKLVLMNCAPHEILLAAAQTFEGFEIYSMSAYFYCSVPTIEGNG